MNFQRTCIDGAWAPALAVASQLRAGQVDVSGARFDPMAPFGAFGKPGLRCENGRPGIGACREPVSIRMPASPFENIS